MISDKIDYEEFVEYLFEERNEYLLMRVLNDQNTLRFRLFIASKLEISSKSAYEFISSFRREYGR